MAALKVPGKPDQNIELAAQAGDPAAMRVMGHYLQTALEPHADQVEAERWLLASAEAGDPEAMFNVSWIYHERAVDAAWMSWCRRAAEAGCVGAMRAMAVITADTDEEESWLRRAAGGGARGEMLRLADLLTRKRQEAEAEQWYHAPIAHGLSSARTDFASFLIAQDRPADAEQYVRVEAEAGSWAAARRLAEVLEKLGRANCSRQGRRVVVGWREQRNRDQAAGSALTRAPSPTPPLRHGERLA
ncbi:tetratricopeptide repeat protein [Streptomyces siamensis]|uniref:Sel1 repeat family protein n=1 Tax=Streptomyces siamensis TaxID=1274986 RepID=A0ABP9J939_9ACTN